MRSRICFKSFLFDKSPLFYLTSVIFLFLGGCSKSDCKQVVSELIAGISCAHKQIGAMECNSVIALGQNIQMETAFPSCNWPAENELESCKTEIFSSRAELITKLGAVLNKPLSCRAGVSAGI